MTPHYVCPVCGYPSLTEPPRYPGGGGSYEICYSCDFEFGVTDDDRGFSYETWRADWVKRGMPWSSWEVSAPPNEWDPAEQLRSIS
jgi:hypothetical protein